MSTQSTLLESLVPRLNDFITALSSTPERILIEEQLSHIARRLQSYCQKPLTSHRQLTLIRHDLASATYWLTSLIDMEFVPAPRLAPLQKDIIFLLTDLKIESPSQLSPVAVDSLPQPTTPQNHLSQSSLNSWLPEKPIAKHPPKDTPAQDPPQLSSKKIKYKGQTYTWTGSGWYDRTNIKPPQIVIAQLNIQLELALATEDQELTDISELIKRAQGARWAMQFNRAEQLSRRILELEPNNHTGATMLCATLRARGHSDQAISETDRFAVSGNSALLTSRAAAFCDLGRWEEAYRSVGHSLAIQASEEAFMVVKRIKVVRPELYNK